MTHYDRKIALVKRMDKIVTSLNDEELIESWLIGGCPDCSTEEDYKWFAEDEEEFLDLVSLFTRITMKAIKK